MKDENKWCTKYNFSLIFHTNKAWLYFSKIYEIVFKNILTPTMLLSWFWGRPKRMFVDNNITKLVNKKYMFVKLHFVLCLIWWKYDRNTHMILEFIRRHHYINVCYVSVSSSLLSVIILMTCPSNSTSTSRHIPRRSEGY